MKIQIGKEQLVKALSAIQSVVERKGPPILSHVLLQAEEGHLKLFATDFDLSMQILLEANVINGGRTTAPARSFLEVAKEFPGQTLELTSDESGRLNVSTEKAFFQLPSLDPSDFPVDQLENEVVYSTCNAQLLKKAISKTLYAIPLTGSSFSIPGLYISCDSSGMCKFISCDAFRLAKYEAPQSEIGLDFALEEIIIPRKGVQEIIRVAEDAVENKISLGIHENVFYVKNEKTTVSMRLMEASFPAFDSVLPPRRPFGVEIPVDLFLQVLKRMAIFTNQTWRHVNLYIAQGVLEISAGNSEIGMGREEIPIPYNENITFSATFNLKYLSDAVNVVSGSFFRFEWSSEMEGGFITDPEDPGYLAFFMPMVAE
ncbi:MAG: DNA polymerase III subunit beta [Thermodesulforhabdaceae bacterium]|jgi:DNA polymerase-3 subunit beta